MVHCCHSRQLPALTSVGVPQSPFWCRGYVRTDMTAWHGNIDTATCVKGKPPFQCLVLPLCPSFWHALTLPALHAGAARAPHSVPDANLEAAYGHACPLLLHACRPPERAGERSRPDGPLVRFCWQGGALVNHTQLPADALKETLCFFALPNRPCPTGCAHALPASPFLVMWPAGQEAPCSNM